MWNPRPPNLNLGWTAFASIDPEFIGLILLLIGLVIGGVVLVIRARRWRDELPGPLTPDQQIEEYRALAEQGALDPKDFARIKAALEQMADQTTPPPTSPESPTSESLRSARGAED